MLANEEQMTLRVLQKCFSKVLGKEGTHMWNAEERSQEILVCHLHSKNQLYVTN